MEIVKKYIIPATLFKFLAIKRLQRQQLRLALQFLTRTLLHCCNRTEFEVSSTLFYSLNYNSCYSNFFYSSTSTTTQRW